MKDKDDKATTFLELDTNELGLEIVGEVTDKGTKLFLECRFIEGQKASPIDSKELRRLLTEHVIEDFLHDNVIEDIATKLGRREDVSRRRIAKGKMPVYGTDSRVLLLVKSMKYGAGEGQYVSSHHIKYFDNIEPGMVVARIYKPKQGNDGMDVFGNRIPSVPGEEIEVEIGEGLTRVSPKNAETNFDTVVSSSYGYLEQQDDSLLLRNTLELNSDIDYRTGDVHFLGNVSIKGNVAKGFHVNARDDILIDGNVEGGTLRSDFGSITVTGTITGSLDVETRTIATANTLRELRLAGREMLGDQISAEKTITVHIVENASVSSKADIVIKKEANQSRLRSRASLLFPEAHLRSGSAYAVCGVEAESIGTKSSSETLLIQLCSDVESSAEYLTLEDSFTLQQDALDMILRLLGPFAEDKEAINSLATAHRERLLGLQTKRGKLESSLAELQTQKDELLEGANYNSVLRVNFKKNLFAGVRVSASGEDFLSEEKIAGPQTLEFDITRNEYVLVELQPLLCEA